MAKFSKKLNILLAIALIAFLDVSPLAGLPITIKLKLPKALAQESTSQSNLAPDQPPKTTSEISIAPPTDEQVKTFDEQLKTLAKVSSQTNAAASPVRGLKINGVDKLQYEAYLKLQRYFAMQGESAPSSTDFSKLPDSLRDELVINNLSLFDTRLMQSIENIITPTNTNGAGHEYADIYRITKDHRTEGNKETKEVLPQADEEPRVSEHYREIGQAVDVSELDYLRGTEFTLEVEVNDKGEPVIGDDGKPVQRVVSYKHLDLEPIKFALQSDDLDAFPGSLPDFYGESPHTAGQTAAESRLTGLFSEEADRHGFDFDASNFDLQGAASLPEIAKQMGLEYLTGIGEIQNLSLGRHAPLSTGQLNLAQASTIPSFGWFGDRLEGSFNGESSWLLNAGREVVTQKLGFAQGAMIGQSSNDVLTNIGERTFEEILGELPLGTLDGITENSRESLEQHVGRGVVAKFFNLYVADIPLDASGQQFEAKLADAFDYIKQNPNLANNAFSLTGQNSQALVNGQIAPNEWLRQIGAERLRVIEQYADGEVGASRRDAAFNIEEKPDVANDLETQIPEAPSTIYTNTSDFVAGTTSYTQEQVDAIKDRAQWLIDNYTFTTDDQVLLEEAVDVKRVALTTSSGPTKGSVGSFSSTGPSLGTTSTKFTLSVEPSKIVFLIIPDDLKSWLTDHAFSPGFDPNRGLRTDRFLAADKSVFREIGVDQVAKSLVKDNNDRTALRQYIRTGVMPVNDQQAPVVNIDEVVGIAGLSSRIEFDAIFRDNAPYTVFENIGRTNLADSLNFSAEKRAKSAFKPIKSSDELSDQLAGLRESFNDLRSSLASGERPLADEGLQTLDEMEGQINEVNVLGANASTGWRQNLVKLYQITQSVSIGENDNVAQQYRDLSLKISDLVTGRNGQELYSISEGRDIKLGQPSGLFALDQLAAALTGKISPNQAIESLGARTIDGYLGVDPGTTFGLYQDISKVFAADQPSRNWQNLLENFAKSYTEELNEAGAYLQLNKFGYDLSGQPINLTVKTGSDRRLALGMAAIENVFQPTPSLVAAGSQSLDKIFGIHGFEFAPDQPGLLGLLTNNVGGDVQQAFDRAQSIQKSFELLTGRANANLLFEEQGNVYLAALNRIVADRTGIPLQVESLLDPNFDWSFDDATFMIQSLTGQPIDEAVKSLGIPIVGDFLADRNTLKEFLNGNVFSDGDFWSNPTVTGRLDTVAAQNGLPAGIIRTLLDRNLTASERQDQLQQAAIPFITSRLTPESINGIFGLEGTDSALAAGGLQGAISILLDNSIADKSNALQNLGTQIADSYTLANFGFSASWLFNEDVSIEEKGLLGIRTLGTALGLDSGINNLATDAFETFFINGGINTNTPQGRQDLTQLINGIGAAAGVPAEFSSVAAGVLTGDIETTVVSYAGQSFIDNQLADFGVGDVRFSDIYEAFISPLPGSRNIIESTAFNETIGQWQSEGLLDKFSAGDRTIEITDPTTGDKVLVPAGMAGALEIRTNELREEFTNQAQNKLQYALGDALLNKAFGNDVAGINVRGLAQAMFEGNADQKLTAFSGMLTQFAGSENAAFIFGSLQAADDLKKFFSTNDINSISATSLNQLDSWFSNITGWDGAPAGSFTAVLDFVKNGSTAGFDRLLNSDYSQFQIGGLVDGALGLPGGTTFTAWQAFESLSQAQAAVDVARTNLFNTSAGFGSFDFASGQVSQAQQALSQAQTNLQLTTASIVTTGINLIFGSTFAGIDSALGLPSGLTSALVSTAITALLVPGISFGALATSVLLPALAPILLGLIFGGGGGIFGGLFGGGTKKITKKEVLWSYHKSNPATKPEDAVKPDYADIRRADWPEEAWYPDPKKESAGNEDLPDRNIEIFMPGKNIAIEEEKDLPEGIFKGNTKEQFLAGAKKAANTKIVELLGDLLILDTDERLGDENFRPNQVCTHQKEQLTMAERRISQLYAPDGTFGSYDEVVDAGQRLGVCFDEDASLLVKFVHWQY